MSDTDATAVAEVLAADLTAASLLAELESATGATTDATAPRTYSIVREPVRYGDTSHSFGLRKSDDSGTVYVFKRTTARDGAVKDRNVCPALDAARAASVGLI